MYRTLVTAVCILLAVNTTAAWTRIRWKISGYDSTKKIASILDDSFERLFGNLTGNEDVLFGNNVTFTCGNCCTEQRAFAGHPPKVDVVIALDASGSVGAKDFKTLKNFAEEITSHFVVSQSATRVAVVTWSTKQTLEFNFTQYINHEGVKIAIRNITYSGGWTATGDALRFIRRSVFTQSPKGAKKVLFFFTDGSSNRGSARPATEAWYLKRYRVEIFAFGIGKDVSNSELSTIASYPTNKHRFRVRTFNDLSSVGSHLSDTDCKNGATVYDACGRKCTCIGGKLINCTRVRKNFLDMTELERCRYIRAIKRASTETQFKTEYDAFVFVHQRDFFKGIHQGRYFLPWHRWYNLEYENILRKVDCRVTAPYWDWSLDSESPFTSDLWSTDLCKYNGFGGNGTPVTTGPFAYHDWQLTPSSKEPCLRWHFNGDSLPACTTILGVLDTTVNNFSDFLMGLEMTIHDPLHFRVSGSFCGIRSSNAPIFFLHHVFIDKLWGDWQDKGIVYKRKEYYRNTTIMPGTVYSPRDVHDLNNLPYYVKVSFEQPKQGCKLPGARIMKISEIANMNVQNRRRMGPSSLPGVPRRGFEFFGATNETMQRLAEAEMRMLGMTTPVMEIPIIPGCDLSID